MQIIGHRGARGLAPENTLTSFHKALEHGVDRIEFDVRVTKDGVAILHHDRNLRDPNGQKHLISQTKYVELKDHKPDLATLDETLKAFGKTPLYIEVKPGEKTDPIIKTIKNYYGAGTDAWLGSKSQKTLVELHEHLPEIPKVVIEPWSGVRASRRARELNTNLLSMNKMWLWWGFISSMSKNYRLYTYTLNSPKRAKRWAKYGLAGVITDYPDLFRKH